MNEDHVIRRLREGGELWTRWNLFGSMRIQLDESLVPRSVMNSLVEQELIEPYRDTGNRTLWRLTKRGLELWV